MELIYFGHIMRGEIYKILKSIIQGHVERRRECGRSLFPWIQNIRGRIGLTTVELFRIAQKRGGRIAMTVGVN